MNKKRSDLPSLNFSMRHANPEPANRRRNRKPVMLHIKGIPDSNSILINHFDHDAGAFSFARSGNVDLLANEYIDDFVHSKMILGGINPKSFHIDPNDFAFNHISDPDLNSKALDEAIEIIEKNNIHCLNHPTLVKNLTRDGFYQQYGDTDGLVIPKTLRVKPGYCRDIQTIIEKGEIQLPAIFRPAGGQDGQNMFLLRSLEDIKELECFAFNGQEYYLIEFHDYRNSDNFYRKYRLIWIDGKIYPRHLIIDKKWKIHFGSVDNYMLDNEAFHQEQLEFLDNFESIFGETRVKTLDNIFADTGLDYCGIDMSLLPNGEILIFEMNPAMNTAINTAEPPLSYMNKYLLIHEQEKIKMLKKAAGRVGQKNL